MTKLKDLTGRTFTHLTVIRRAPNHGKHTKWKCSCACGATVEVMASNLVRGNSPSCGCIIGFKIEHLVNQETLKRLLRYDKETGTFTRIIDTAHGIAGERVGGFSKSTGYTIIAIGATQYLAHRLAVLYVTGKWPVQVDHKNGVKTDNKWENLRECTPSQNNANRALSNRNKTGFHGVHRTPSAWAAHIRDGKKIIYLGSFKTAEKAALAYDDKAVDIFGEFAALNFPRHGFNVVRKRA